MNLIWEIHRKAEYSNSSLENTNICELLKEYQKYCKMVNIITEPTLWWDFDLVKEVKNSIDLPTSLLHFKITDTIINKAKELGVNSLIIIYTYNKNKIQEIINNCEKNWINTIVEIWSIEETLEILSLSWIKNIWINTRNLENLKDINFDKVKWIIKVIKDLNPNIKIIWESWLEYNQQVKWLEVNSWIVWSSILKSRFPEKSVKYFHGNEIDLPYIWLRPSAFSWEKFLKIKNKIEEQGFEVQHTIKMNDFLPRFFNLKRELFYNNPKIWKLFFTAMEEATLYMSNKLMIDSWYNEIWFLENEYNTLEESYTNLLKIKEKLRIEEDESVKKIKKFWKDIDIKIHSLHTPDYKDHYTDINNIYDQCNKRFETMKNIKKIYCE